MRCVATTSLVIAALSLYVLMASRAGFARSDPRIAPVDSSQSADVTSQPAYSTRSTGPDILIGDLQGVWRAGRVGDITAYAVGTNACNVGDERVSVRVSANGHPVCVQGMYRLKEGRFEQVGLGWGSHG